MQLRTFEVQFCTGRQIAASAPLIGPSGWFALLAGIESEPVWRRVAELLDVETWPTVDSIRFIEREAVALEYEAWAVECYRRAANAPPLPGPAWSMRLFADRRQLLRMPVGSAPSPAYGLIRDPALWARVERVLDDGVHAISAVHFMRAGRL